MCTDLVFGPGFDQSVPKGLFTCLLKTPSWACGYQDQHAQAPPSIFPSTNWSPATVLGAQGGLIPVSQVSPGASLGLTARYPMVASTNVALRGTWAFFLCSGG